MAEVEKIITLRQLFYMLHPKDKDGKDTAHYGTFQKNHWRGKIKAKAIPYEQIGIQRIRFRESDIFEAYPFLRKD